MNYYFKGDMIIDLSNNIPFINAHDLNVSKPKNELVDKKRNFTFQRQVYKNSSMFLNPHTLGQLEFTTSKREIQYLKDITANDDFYNIIKN